jgi:hypothetical protein
MSKLASEQEHPQFTIYADKAAIPAYQRAWVWGVTALAILLCGLAAGWLFAGGERRAASDPPSGARSADSGALLVRQEAVNGQLRERITRLEQALAGDACGPAALEALTRTTGKP